jgi:parvulin-like peptidyl-prolyl isomerase
MLTVGGKAVTRAQYEEYLATLVNYYANYGYDSSTDPELAAILKQYTLDTGVEYALLDLKLVELGLSLSDEEKAAATQSAKEEWEATLQDGLAYYGITAESSEEDRANTLLTVLAELESMGYTEESYLADAITFAGYDKLMNYVTRDVTVSDEDVVNYYNGLVEADKQTYENDAAAYEQTMYMNDMYAMYGMTDYVTEIYYKPAGYRLVTHILLEASEELLTAYTDLQAAYEEQQNTIEEGGEVTGELVTEAEIENARLAILADVQPKVDEINQKLADGATFAELIPLYSTDPGMMDEASIAAGYEVHMDSTNWVIPFRDQAFTVSNIGDVTAPVVTDYGVHIIQYVADVPGGPVELTEEMRASFQESLLASAQNEKYSAAIAEWVEAAEVVYSDEAKAILGATDEAAQ